MFDSGSIQVSDENIWTPWNGGYSTPELQKLQRDDTDIGPILLWKENGSRPTIKELLSRLMDRLVKPCMELAMSIALL
jgi:hypothetical protein